MKHKSVKVTEVHFFKGGKIKSKITGLQCAFSRDRGRVGGAIIGIVFLFADIDLTRLLMLTRSSNGKAENSRNENLFPEVRN